MAEEEVIYRPPEEEGGVPTRYMRLLQTVIPSRCYDTCYGIVAALFVT